MKLEKFFQTRVGDGGGDGGDGGRIFLEHPGPIIHAPRDIISRKGKSLTPIISSRVVHLRMYEMISQDQTLQSGFAMVDIAHKL